MCRCIAEDEYLGSQSGTRSSSFMSSSAPRKPTAPVGLLGGALTEKELKAPKAPTCCTAAMFFLIPS